MTKNNIDIRAAIQNAGLFQYMVSDRLGVTEATFIRWLRKELPGSKKKEILEVIEELKHAMQREKK